MPESPYPMIDIEEAIRIVRQETPVLSETTLSFAGSLGFVLAQDVFAEEAMPPFPAASVDGFAVIAAEGPGPRRIIGDQMAGHIADLRVEPGTAARVMTGAPIPPGADAMVMVEQTEEKAGQVNILAQRIEAGANIRPVGQEIQKGQRVLAKGATLGPAEIGLLGTVGQTAVSVYRRPKVAVISTGDEIVEPSQQPAPGQIRDSNRFSLMNVVQQSGGDPLDQGIVRDKPGILEPAFEQALSQADVLITSGGVSMGELDLVKPYLASRGMVHFGRVRSKPGKPVTFAVVDGKPCFALPGFPVSAMVSFEIYVRPALRKMAGHSRLYRPVEKVRLAHPVRHGPDRTEFQRANLIRQPDGMLEASTTGFQGSGRLLSMVGADGLLILPRGQGDFEAGTVVEAIRLGLNEVDTPPVRGV